MLDEPVTITKEPHARAVGGRRIRVDPPASPQSSKSPLYIVARNQQSINWAPDRSVLFYSVNVCMYQESSRLKGKE